MMSKIQLSTGILLLSAMAVAAQPPQSAGILEFGPDNTLFVADTLTGAIHAYDLPAEGPAPEQDVAYNLLDVDLSVTNALGAQGRLIYGDLAVHPVTRDAYVSVMATVDGVATLAVVSITRQGDVTTLDLSTLPSTRFDLSDPGDPNVTFWRDIPAPTLTITDLDFMNDDLFVSGVSTKARK